MKDKERKKEGIEERKFLLFSKPEVLKNAVTVTVRFWCLFHDSSPGAVYPGTRIFLHAFYNC